MLRIVSKIFFSRSQVRFIFYCVELVYRQILLLSFHSTFLISIHEFIDLFGLLHSLPVSQRHFGLNQ